MAGTDVLYNLVESIKTDATDAFSFIESADEDNLTGVIAELERVQKKSTIALDAALAVNDAFSAAKEALDA